LLFHVLPFHQLNSFLQLLLQISCILHVLSPVTDLVYPTCIFSCYRSRVSYMYFLLLQISCILHVLSPVTDLVYPTCIISCYRSRVSYMYCLLLQISCILHVLSPVTDLVYPTCIVSCCCSCPCFTFIFESCFFHFRDLKPRALTVSWRRYVSTKRCLSPTESHGTRPQPTPLLNIQIIKTRVVSNISFCVLEPTKLFLHKA
jgi:hypothetical protein